MSGIPRPALAFSLLHVLIGLWLLWALIAMRCVDPPDPYLILIDGCTSHSDPWRDGSAPYFLAIIIAFVLSAIGLLRPIRPARMIFLVATAAVLLIPFSMSVVAVKEHMGWMNDPGGWAAAWDEASQYFSFRHHYLFWLVSVAWLLVNSWFLYGSRARSVFTTPSAPQTTLPSSNMGR